VAVLDALHYKIYVLHEH